MSRGVDYTFSLDFFLFGMNDLRGKGWLGGLDKVFGVGGRSAKCCTFWERMFHFSDFTGSGEQTNGEQEEGQDAVDGDAEDAEGDQQEPENGVEDQRQQGQGPTEEEKYAPEEEGSHGFRYGGWKGKVPWGGLRRLC